MFPSSTYYINLTLMPNINPKHRQSRVNKTYCFPEISVNKYFIIYQESKKRNIRANFIQKYLKYFIAAERASLKRARDNLCREGVLN